MFTRQVKTENGWVRGLPAADPRITSYKGIPFAAPPVGENPWRRPAALRGLGRRAGLLRLQAHLHAGCTPS